MPAVPNEPELIRAPRPQGSVRLDAEREAAELVRRDIEATAAARHAEPDRVGRPRAVGADQLRRAVED